jgi:hypothetical protein
MSQHFFCNAMPIGEIQGDVAVVRFVMESPIDPVPLAGIDGVFTPHSARAAAEVFARLAASFEARHRAPPPVAQLRKR